MKKILAVSVLALMALTASAIKPQDIKIYINPGHGGHDSDDRNVVIAPYTQGDPEGFWESNSNLDKGLYLRDMLIERGYNVAMSRVTNTTDDDLGLSTICSLANNYGADIFLSIHSNATGTTARVNYPMVFFRGYDSEPVFADAKTFAQIADGQLLENGSSVWTSTNTNVRGDWSFYTSWGDKVGLGVLRTLAMKGVLSEGSFHDYIPETYRLMNMDFKWLEAWHFLKAFEEFFGITDVDKTGIIAGVVYDDRALRNVSYVRYDRDKLAPMNGAKVVLLDNAGNTLQEYTTDQLENGFYLFKNLTPGSYKIKTSVADHYDSELDVEVTANKVSYSNVAMKLVRNTAPQVVEYSPVWKEGDELVVCNTPINLRFNWDMDAATTEAAFSITPAVPGKFAWSDANYALTFTPSEALETNTLYTVKLAKTAQHQGGMEMAEDFVFTFKTNDRNYMSLLSMWPTEGAVIDINNPSVMINVDSPLSMTYINQTLQVKDSQGNVLSWNARQRKAGAYDDPYGWVRLPISTALKEGETYTFYVPQEVQDKKGITLEQSYTAKFTAKSYKNAPETGALVLDFEDATACTVNADKSVDATAKIASATGTVGKAVKVTYTFGEGEGTLFLNIPTVETNTFSAKDVVGIDIFGDLSNNTVCAVFEAEGDIKQVPLAADVNFYAWQRLSADLSTALATGVNYSLIGIVVEQKNKLQGAAGELQFDNFYYYANESGVDANTIAGLSIYPNPASEYVIANADALIQSISLYATDGTLVASKAGNVLNVSEVAQGAYIVKVEVSGAVATSKIIVKH